MPFILRQIRMRRPTASRDRGRRTGAPDRARRALACLVVAAEILVIAWAGAGTVTIECRLLSPIGEHRFGITAWITRGAELQTDWRLVVRACPTLASLRS